MFPTNIFYDFNRATAELATKIGIPPQIAEKNNDNVAPRQNPLDMLSSMTSTALSLVGIDGLIPDKPLNVNALIEMFERETTTAPAPAQAQAQAPRAPAQAQAPRDPAPAPRDPAPRDPAPAPRDPAPAPAKAPRAPGSGSGSAPRASGSSSGSSVYGSVSSDLSKASSIASSDNGDVSQTSTYPSIKSRIVSLFSRNSSSTISNKPPLASPPSQSSSFSRALSFFRSPDSNSTPSSQKANSYDGNFSGMGSVTSTTPSSSPSVSSSNPWRSYFEKNKSHDSSLDEGDKESDLNRTDSNKSSNGSIFSRVFPKSDSKSNDANTSPSLRSVNTTAEKKETFGLLLKEGVNEALSNLSKSSVKAGIKVTNTNNHESKEYAVTVTGRGVVNGLSRAKSLLGIAGSGLANGLAKAPPAISDRAASLARRARSLGASSASTSVSDGIGDKLSGAGSEFVSRAGGGLWAMGSVMSSGMSKVKSLRKNADVRGAISGGINKAGSSLQGGAGTVGGVMSRGASSFGSGASDLWKKTKSYNYEESARDAKRRASRGAEVTGQVMARGGSALARSGSDLLGAARRYDYQGKAGQMGNALASGAGAAQSKLGYWARRAKSMEVSAVFDTSWSR